MPQISIIIPVYNVAQYLRKCLDSVIAQTFVNWECVCIDDGSTDGSGDILDEYAINDDRFKVMHKKNAGYSSAMNCGIDRIRGEWFGIVEPDDWIERDMYECLLSSVSEDVDVVKGNFVSFHADTQEVRHETWRSKDRFGLMSQHPSVWTCLYRTKFIRDKKIFFLHVPGAAWTDNLFMYQTLVLARGVKYVDRIVYHYLVKSWEYIDCCSNFRIPLDRIREIIEWASTLDGVDCRVWQSLQRRTLSYISTAYAKARRSELIDYRRRVRRIAKVIPRDINLERELQRVLSAPILYFAYSRYVRSGKWNSWARKLYRYLRKSGEFSGQKGNRSIH